MIDRVPKSVANAVAAAVRDIVSAMNGGSFRPTGFDSRAAQHMENFMMGMVSNHYPAVRSKWVDSSKDTRWVSAADSGTVNLQEAYDKIKAYFSTLPPEKQLELLGQYNGVDPDGFARVIIQTITGKTIDKIDPEVKKILDDAGAAGAHPGAGATLGGSPSAAKPAPASPGEGSGLPGLDDLSHSSPLSEMGKIPGETQKPSAGKDREVPNARHMDSKSPSAKQKLREEGDVAPETDEEKAFTQDAGEAPEVVPHK